MKERTVKQFLSGIWYRWEWGGHKERMREGKYAESTVYSYVKMEQWDMLKLF
jgi:hypothetical protein